MMSSSNSSSHRASSGSDEGPIETPIVRRSPTKLRAPSKKGLKVRPGSQREPEFDLDSQLDFPPLPPSSRGPSASGSSEDDHGTIISARVEAAIR